MALDARKPALIQDLPSLRASIAASMRAGDRRGELWKAVLRCSRGSPRAYPWLTPFVALVTGEEPDIRTARQTLETYRAKLDPVAFGSGMQYHFWCFAFPHAKWCLYLQWLECLGAWSREEAASMRHDFLVFAYTNFLYGMRSKPEPECIDNQALSLCLSCALVGWLCDRGDDPSATAALMRDEGMRRLPGILGGLPPSGYCGEGASYMDCVIGPAVPLVVELLREAGGDTQAWTRELPPNGVSPLTIARMVAREWLPGGLLLPWDNYGYQYGVRSCLAYAAARSEEPLFRELLERDAIWSYDIGVGWAYDDLTWTVAWWPDREGAARGRARESWQGWFEPQTGGMLGSREHTLVQIWDESEPAVPTRRHVNPNALTLSTRGVPLTLDGTPDKGFARFDFPDTWRTVTHHIGESTRYNYGSGCGGAHSVLVVDGAEDHRALHAYPQVKAAGSDGGAIWADVTPLYAERWPDIHRVHRRSSWHEGRFFVVVDTFEADRTHRVATRFLLRPTRVDTPVGLAIETAEGACLQIVPVGDAAPPVVQTAAGFPDCLERRCLIADFVHHGSRIRATYVLFPGSTRTARPIPPAWTAVPDPDASLGPVEAARELDRGPHRLPFRMPAFMEADVPIARRWWYRTRIRPEPASRVWLRLPRNLMDARLWLNGRETDPGDPVLSKLMQPDIELPPAALDAGEVEILVRTDVPVSHWEGAGWGTTGLNGVAALCYPEENERVLDAVYRRGDIVVRTDRSVYTVPAGDSRAG